MWWEILKFVLIDLGVLVLFVTTVWAIFKKFGNTWVEQKVKSHFDHGLELHKAELQAQNAHSLEEFKAELQKQHAHVVQQIQAESENVAARREADKVLFEKFRKTLPSEWVKDFIYNRSPGEPFEGNKLDPLYNFLCDWTDAEHKFLDEELEAKSKEVFKLATEYCNHIGQRIGPWESNPELTCYIPRDIKQSEHYGEAVESILERSGAFYQSHQEFVDLARKKLNC